MSTETTELVIAGVEVQVVRKDIKNLHLAAYPPDGRVRIAVPLHVDDEAVRLAVTSRISWIRSQQSEFADQARQSRREMRNGESHYFRGRRYRLSVTEVEGRQRVRVQGAKLEMTVLPHTTVERRRELLDQWYRDELKRRVPKLLAKWQPLVGANAEDWGVKRMRTRWGSCNPDTRRIWLNLELIKKSPECLEYIVVHELVHLLERTHNDAFKAHMDRLMPQWRLHRETLNSAPLKHEDWAY